MHKRPWPLLLFMMLALIMPAGCSTAAPASESPSIQVQHTQTVAATTPGQAEPAASPPENAEEAPAKAEYFIKGLCGAIHSVCFGDDGFMYVGSLGDTPSDVRKTGLKKILKISPGKDVETVEEIECKYITALCVAGTGDIFAAVLDDKEKARIIRIDRNGGREVMAEGLGECGTLALDAKANLYASATTGMYTISADKGTSLLLPDESGITDAAFQYVYTNTANSLQRYPLDADGSLGAVETVSGIQGAKRKLFGPNGELWILAYWSGEKIISVDTHSGTSTDTKIDMSDIEESPLRTQNPMPWLNHAALGKGEFGADYMYITTWSGDIIRVKLP